MTIIILFIVSLLSFCGIALDGWRILLTTRQINDVAEVAALAGMNQLRSNPESLDVCHIGSNSCLISTPGCSDTCDICTASGGTCDLTYSCASSFSICRTGGTSCIVGSAGCANTCDACNIGGTCNSTCTTGSLAGWQNSKKAVLAALKVNHLAAYDNAAVNSLANASARYQSGVSTTNDLTGYDHLTANFGNTSVTVERGIVCYLDSTKRKFFSLENRNNTYCYANAVNVQIKLNNLNSSFAQVFGIDQLPTLRGKAGARVKPIPSSCGQTLCSVFGVVDSVAGTFIPHAPCS